MLSRDAIARLVRIRASRAMSGDLAVPRSVLAPDALRGPACRLPGLTRPDLEHLRWTMPDGAGLHCRVDGRMTWWHLDRHDACTRPVRHLAVDALSALGMVEKTPGGEA